MNTDKLKKIGMTMLVALGGILLLNTIAKRSTAAAKLRDTVNTGL